MTKKELKEKNKINRVMPAMNTGEKVFKSAKDYDRKRSKKEVKKLYNALTC